MSICCDKYKTSFYQYCPDCGRQLIQNMFGFLSGAIASGQSAIYHIASGMVLSGYIGNSSTSYSSYASGSVPSGTIGTFISGNSGLLVSGNGCRGVLGKLPNKNNQDSVNVIPVPVKRNPFFVHDRGW